MTSAKSHRIGAPTNMSATQRSDNERPSLYWTGACAFILLILIMAAITVTRVSQHDAPDPLPAPTPATQPEPAGERIEHSPEMQTLEWGYLPVRRQDCPAMKAAIVNDATATGGYLVPDSHHGDTFTVAATVSILPRMAPLIGTHDQYLHPSYRQWFQQRSTAAPTKPEAAGNLVAITIRLQCRALESATASMTIFAIDVASLITFCVLVFSAVRLVCFRPNPMGKGTSLPYDDDKIATRGDTS